MIDNLTMAKILRDAFVPAPAVKAAMELRRRGITSQRLQEFCQTATGQCMPEVWTNNTINEMRDMEAKECAAE